MHEVVLNLRGFNDRYAYEDWESNLEAFFCYFPLTSDKKWVYVRMKLVGEPSYWVEGNHKLCRYWSLLQSLLRTRYAPHLLSVPD